MEFSLLRSDPKDCFSNPLNPQSSRSLCSPRDDGWAVRAVLAAAKKTWLRIVRISNDYADLLLSIHSFALHEPGFLSTAHPSGSGRRSVPRPSATNSSGLVGHGDVDTRGAIRGIAFPNSRHSRPQALALLPSDNSYVTPRRRDRRRGCFHRRAPARTRRRASRGALLPVVPSGLPPYARTA